MIIFMLSLSLKLLPNFLDRSNLLARVPYTPPEWRRGVRGKRLFGLKMHVIYLLMLVLRLELLLCGRTFSLLCVGYKHISTGLFLDLKRRKRELASLSYSLFTTTRSNTRVTQVPFRFYKALEYEKEY